jgi:molybdate transport system substrate-binding protein
MKWKLVVKFVVMLLVVAMPVINSSDALAGQELIVSAAASLTNAFQEAGAKFEAANPGAKVVFNFGASGALLQQIENGAPVDVFASADQKTMDQAENKKLILTDTRKDFVSNKLVLIVPTESKIRVASPRDLVGKEVTKIAMGNPDTVPAGRYAQEVLSNEGLWEILKSKMINGESVRQVLDYVSRGEVDAGFVFSTDAVVAKDKVRVAVVLEKHEPIMYPIAVVAGTQKRELAQHFVDFVLHGEGQEILSKYGFGRP